MNGERWSVLPGRKEKIRKIQAVFSSTNPLRKSQGVTWRLILPAQNHGTGRLQVGTLFLTASSMNNPGGHTGDKSESKILIAPRLNVTLNPLDLQNATEGMYLRMLASLYSGSNMTLCRLVLGEHLLIERMKIQVGREGARYTEHVSIQQYSNPTFVFNMLPGVGRGLKKERQPWHVAD